MINQVVYRPPRIVTCKECGEKIKYSPPYCTSLPMALPATPKGWIRMIFGRKINKKVEDREIGNFYIECPVCGSDLKV